MLARCKRARRARGAYAKHVPRGAAAAAAAAVEAGGARGHSGGHSDTAAPRARAAQSDPVQTRFGTETSPLYPPNRVVLLCRAFAFTLTTTSAQTHDIGRQRGAAQPTQRPSGGRAARGTLPRWSALSALSAELRARGTCTQLEPRRWRSTLYSARQPTSRASYSER